MRQTFSKCCAIFCTFSPLTTWKIKILKLKKIPGHIILHICTINDNHDICFLRYGAWSTQLFVILDHFLHFYCPNNPKNQKFGMRKPSQDIITLNKCTINNNHIMYGSWDMDPVKSRFFCHFGLFFALFSPPHAHNLPPPKKKIEKMKNLAGDIIILHICTINNNHLIYGSWDIERIGTWSFFFGTYGLFTGFKLGKKGSFTECLGFVKYWFEKTFDTETVHIYLLIKMRS